MVDHSNEQKEDQAFNEVEVQLSGSDVFTGPLKYSDILNPDGQLKHPLSFDFDKALAIRGALN